MSDLAKVVIAFQQFGKLTENFIDLRIQYKQLLLSICN